MKDELLFSVGIILHPSDFRLAVQPRVQRFVGPHVAQSHGIHRHLWLPERQLRRWVFCIPSLREWLLSLKTRTGLDLFLTGDPFRIPNRIVVYKTNTFVEAHVATFCVNSGVAGFLIITEGSDNRPNRSKNRFVYGNLALTIILLNRS